MEGIYNYIYIVLFAPLAGFVLLGFFGKQLKELSGSIGTIGMLLSAVFSYTIAWQYFFVNEKVNETYQSIVIGKQTWLSFTKDLNIDFGMMLDPISVMMLVVITTVSLMVHIYSIGYMHGEKRFGVYYSFLSLFTFSMLGLVLSVNLFQMYMFWELVGVSSFLLIGFYYEKPLAVAAAKKAFIVTRFADLGFLAGILILSFYSNSLDFGTIINNLSQTDGTIFKHTASTGFMGASALTWALTLIFVGGAGKSAMFPLHIWLPDAMEGPTPVSALIHAATMVVAGVFLVARLFPIYHLDPVVLDLVAYTGVFSALFAAVIACTQTDIKRILAYSTMSQIGYMMFSLGVSGMGGEAGLGYTASMFHLFTHAMFKAALFLCAGAVIHYVHSNELSDMGGLRKKMPLTNLVFLISCLAISGIPPLSGFFSKEEILTAAWHHNQLIYFTGLFSAALTAFYMFRLYFGIFWNREFVSHHHDTHHTEAPWSMKIPLIILAVATLISGFIPFGSLVSSDGKALNSEFHLNFAIVAVAAGAFGITIATIFYARLNNRANTFVKALGSFYQSIYRKFYVDELYLFVTKRIIFNLIGRPAVWIDQNIVDGLMRGIGWAGLRSSDTIRALQSGKVADYALWFFLGTIGMVLFILYLI